MFACSHSTRVAVFGPGFFSVGGSVRRYIPVDYLFGFCLLLFLGSSFLGVRACIRAKMSPACLELSTLCQPIDMSRFGTNNEARRRPAR